MKNLYTRDSFENCSTAIIGKNASATGFVLFAHSEDDDNCICQSFVVPRCDHPDGEIITFPDGTAQIPQVKTTCRYIWNEFRHREGAAFADSFLNEYGVAVASDSCISTKESRLPYTAGIGYGLRRIIAERATTARHGVEIAARLIEKYGYRSTRAYHICDKDEGWVLQCTVGNQYVARRVGDDEIYFNPNWLTIHNVDFTDTDHKNYYWSKDVVKYAMDNGWYTPKTEDYLDFDYALAYQGEGSDVKSNLERSGLGWKYLTGREYPHRTFSVKAERKYSPEDMKTFLKLHYPEHGEDLKKDPATSPHRYGICRETTVESYVTEFCENPDLTVMWRSMPRGCTSPYMPWFAGITKAPDGWSVHSIENTRATHFAPPDSDFEYNSDFAYWPFHILQNLMEFDYHYCEETVRPEIDKIEQNRLGEAVEIKKRYEELSKTDKAAATELLNGFVNACGQADRNWANAMILKLVDRKNADNIAKWR